MVLKTISSHVYRKQLALTKLLTLKETFLLNVSFERWNSFIRHNAYLNKNVEKPSTVHAMKFFIVIAISRFYKKSHPILWWRCTILYFHEWTCDKIRLLHKTKFVDQSLISGFVGVGLPRLLLV